MSIFSKGPDRNQSTHPGFIPIRRHKGLIFRPVAMYKSKRKVNAYLKHSREGEKLANDRYYRVWHHKHHGYVVYQSDKVKRRYGGVRRRSPKGFGPYTKYR